MFIRRPEYVIIKMLPENHVMIVNIQKEEKAIYDEIASVILSYVDHNPHHIDELVSQIMPNFCNVTPNELKKDLIAFFNELNIKGFILIEQDINQLIINPLKDLHLEITMKCNERCLHCYLPNEIKDKAEILSFNKIRSIINEFTQMGGKTIILSGGEPLLHPDFLDILKYCHLKQLDIAVFSNLTLFTEMHLRAFKDYAVKLVQTSIYSLDSSKHDFITQNKGSLKKTLQNLELLYKNNIHVQIACPVMKDNKDDIVELLKYARQKNIRLRTNALLLPQINGNRTFCKGAELTLEEKGCMICNLLEEDLEYTKDNLLKVDNYSAQIANETDRFLSSPRCNAGYQCCISTNGNVYPCPEWTTFKLGNIFEKSLYEIWNTSKELKSLIEVNQFKNFPRCIECEAIDFCKFCFNLNSTKGPFLCPHDDICKESFLTKELVEKNSIANT